MDFRLALSCSRSAPAEAVKNDVVVAYARPAIVWNYGRHDGTVVSIRDPRWRHMAGGGGPAVGWVWLLGHRAELYLSSSARFSCPVGIALVSSALGKMKSDASTRRAPMIASKPICSCRKISAVRIPKTGMRFRIIVDRPARTWAIAKL